MIPRGRKVITPAQIAALAGVSLTTWRRRDLPSFIERVESITPDGTFERGPGGGLLPGRYEVYDLRQTLDYLAGKPVRSLSADPHPGDLLNDKEVASVLGVSESTIQGYRARGQFPAGQHPKDADEQDITTIRVTSRRAVEAYRDLLPADHIPGKSGRPSGTAIQDEARELYDSGQATTPQALADALGITRRHADRLLSEQQVGVREEREEQRAEREKRARQQEADVRALLAASGPKPPTLQNIADELGVSKSQAGRLVQAVRAGHNSGQ